MLGCCAKAATLKSLQIAFSNRGFRGLFALRLEGARTSMGIRGPNANLRNASIPYKASSRACESHEFLRMSRIPQAAQDVG